MSLEPLTDYSKFKVDCEKILHSYNDKIFVQPQLDRQQFVTPKDKG